MIIFTKETKEKILKNIPVIYKFLKYNVRIVFGGKFIYFLIFALLLYITIMLINLFNNEIPSEDSFYYILIIPSIAIILYPSAFSVQNDYDMKTLELMFGIPDYRFKVWFTRLIMVFIIDYVIILALSLISHLLITDIRYFKMALQLMFPTIFCGCLAFMMSTWFKSGTGAAVVLVILLLVFFIFQDYFEENSWYIYFNPFFNSGSKSDLVWHEAFVRNRLYLTGLSGLFLLFGLFNLQNREGFLK